MVGWGRLRKGISTGLQSLKSTRYRLQFFKEVLCLEEFVHLLDRVCIVPAPRVLKCVTFIIGTVCCKGCEVPVRVTLIV